MVLLLFFTRSTITSTSATVTMTTKKAEGTDAMMEIGNEVMSLVLGVEAGGMEDTDGMVVVEVR